MDIGVDCMDLVFEKLVKELKKSSMCALEDLGEPGLFAAKLNISSYVSEYFSRFGSERFQDNFAHKTCTLVLKRLYQRTPARNMSRMPRTFCAKKLIDFKEQERKQKDKLIESNEWNPL